MQINKLDASEQRADSSTEQEQSEHSQCVHISYIGSPTDPMRGILFSVTKMEHDRANLTDFSPVLFWERKSSVQILEAGI